VKNLKEKEMPQGSTFAEKALDRFYATGPSRDALENCRLFAARHRKEEWAKTILRFCAEGGAAGSPLRTAAEIVSASADSPAKKSA
jgi:hypothetical protein